jgi:Zn-dependent peptidase ImmA (M78 family)
VPIRTDSYYRGLVDEQLKRVGFAEPPVSLEDVAQAMGVPVRDVVFPAWFTGAVLIQDGMPLILLNAQASAEGRRAATGHMLGHILMRIDDPATPYPREVDGDHRSAETMAEEFVMPEFMVRDQAGKWFNDHRYLARLFGVSETDMMERMRELGLIKARGIQWDY